MASAAGWITLVTLSSLGASSCAKQAVRPEYPPSESRALGAPARGASRILIATASMQVAVASVPEAVEGALRIVAESGGYAQESSTQKDGVARLKLRVPADRLTAVLDRLGKLGEEKRRQVSSEDVTDRMVDLEAELANKRALRDRLRALLGRAKDVKDVLAVEAELTRVQTELDSTEGRLKKMREDVAFSVVQLELSAQPEKQRRILGPLGYLYVGTKWFITKLFVIRPGSGD